MLYKEGHWDFKDRDVIGIICQYANNPNKSNKGGKTTILEAMKYNLTGKTRAKTKTQLIHHGEEVMMTEMGLIDENGTLFVIKRGHDYKNHSMLECDWVDKKRDAQKAIDELIGCDGKEFELTNFFKKKETGDFMTLSPPEKQKYVMKRFNNTHWIELYKSVSDDLTKKLKELDKIRTKRETIVEDTGDAKKVKAKVKLLEEKITKKEASIQALRSKRKLLEKKLKSDAEIDDLEDELNTIDEQLREIEHSISVQEEIRHKITDVELKIDALKKKKKKLGVMNTSVYKEYISEKSKCENEAKEIRAKLKTVEKNFCGICPLLNEGCDRIKKDPKQIKLWGKKVKELDAYSQNFEDRIDKMERAKVVQTSLKDAENKLSQLTKGKKGTKPLAEKKKALEAKFEALKAEIDKGKDDKLQSKIDAISLKITKKKLGLDGLNQKLGQYQSNLVRIKKAKSRVEEIDNSILVLDKEIKDLKYLAFMFGKSGIPSQEVENAFQDIEGEVNFILEKFNTPMEVSFNAYKETGKLEEDCVGCGWRFPKGYRQSTCQECGEERLFKRKDELHLKVIEYGNESAFEMESDGGQFFVSFAVRIALTMLKQRQTGSNFRVLFLDEIDSSLDKDAREQLMKLITTILIKKFGFVQIFWVSHFDNIQENLPHTLRVLRKKKSATAKWV